MTPNLMEKIVSLCKRRGFVFQSSEIYGGFGSCYDFGPLGVEMKNNIKKIWWDEMTRNQEDIVGLDAAILMKPEVWKASGHLTAGFADELVECRQCNKRFRYDQLEELTIKEISKELEKEGTIGIPEVLKVQGEEFQKKWRKCECGEIIKESPRKFNLMMKTSVGPVEDESAIAYLRAETCQGIYMNYENVLNSMRVKVPFGICQIGKAFRNEITPKDFIYRTREFEQMEMQWFCSPLARRTTRNERRTKRGTDAEKRENWGPDDWFDYWRKERLNWYLGLGIKKENLRIIEHKKEELPHYAKAGADIEYHFPFGWKEIEGIHNRGDWDLSNHSKYSGKDLSYVDELRSSSRRRDGRRNLFLRSSSPSLRSVFDEETKKKYFPYIIETSGGADRSFLAFLSDAYTEIKGGRTETTKKTKEIEILLKLDKRIAPIKVAVLPLVKNKPELVKKAKEVYQLLKPHFTCQYDELGSIGRRYRRVDEIGCPWAITIDFDALKDNTVTLRCRDTMKQERVKIEELVALINEKLKN